MFVCWRHRQQVGGLGDPDARRGSPRSRRSHVDDHGDLQRQLARDDLAHRLLETARRVEDDHRGRVPLSRSLRELVVQPVLGDGIDVGGEVNRHDPRPSGRARRRRARRESEDEQEHGQEQALHRWKDCMSKLVPILAAAAALASPGLARANDVAMRFQDVPIGSRSLAAAPARMHFNMLAAHWTGTGQVLYRTHRLHGGWSGWTAADADAAPDGGTGSWHDGSLEWTGAADGFQFRRRGLVERLRVYELWSRVTTRASRIISEARRPRSWPGPAGMRTRRSSARHRGSHPPFGWPSFITPPAPTRTHQPRRRRSCAASRSTTCRETAGTTSATTFSSTGSARCTRVAAEGSPGT